MFSFCEFHDDDRDREVERPVFTFGREIDESIYTIQHVRSKGSLVSIIRGILLRARKIVVNNNAQKRQNDDRDDSRSRTE